MRGGGLWPVGWSGVRMGGWGYWGFWGTVGGFGDEMEGTLIIFRLEPRLGGGFSTSSCVWDPARPERVLGS